MFQSHLTLSIFKIPNILAIIVVGTLAVGCVLLLLTYYGNTSVLYNYENDLLPSRNNDLNIPDTDDDISITVMIVASHHKTGARLSHLLVSEFAKWNTYIKSNFNTSSYYIYSKFRKSCCVNNLLPTLTKKQIDDRLHSHYYNQPFEGECIDFIHSFTSKQYKKNIKLCNNYIFFHLIRNPIDIILSGYNYHKQNNGEKWTHFELILQDGNFNLDNQMKSQLTKQDLMIQNKYESRLKDESSGYIYLFPFDIENDVKYFLVNENDNDNVKTSMINNKYYSNQFYRVNYLIEKYNNYNRLLQSISIQDGLTFEFLKVKNGYGTFYQMYHLYQYIKNASNKSNKSNESNESKESKTNINLFNIRFETLTQKFDQTIEFMLNRTFDEKEKEKEKEKIINFLVSNAKQYDINSPQSISDKVWTMLSSHVTNGKYDRNFQINMLLKNKYTCKDIKLMTLAMDYDWVYDQYC